MQRPYFLNYFPIFPVKLLTLKVKPKERIILGIDPGTSITGYGVIKTCGTVPELVTIGSIDLSKFDDHYVKLKHIFERTIGIIDEYHPDELAIEAPLRKKCAVDAEAWKSTGCSYCGGAHAVIANLRICAQEDKNVNHGPGSSFKGTGCSNAHEYPEVQFH